MEAMWHRFRPQAQWSHPSGCHIHHYRIRILDLAKLRSSSLLVVAKKRTRYWLLSITWVEGMHLHLVKHKNTLWAMNEVF